jgi:carbohydrate-selective porin OprB
MRARRAESYKFGGWYDTSTANDVVSDIASAPAIISGLPFRQDRGRSGATSTFCSRSRAAPKAIPTAA